MILFSVTLFIIGACIGSFLNVVVDRIPQKRSLWRGRSVCDSCNKKLGPSELIPVVSFLVLRGKCRHCHAKIPSRLTLVELLTGFMFVFSFFALQGSVLFYVLSLIAICINIAVFFTDLEYGIIPDEFVILLSLASVILIFLYTPGDVLNHLISGILAFLLFFALYLITRGKGLGFGDVKYVFAMGLFLGFPDIAVAFYFAFLTGAAVSIILILYGKKGLKSAVPFGPFLASGTIFALFFAEKSIEFFTLLLLR